MPYDLVLFDLDGTLSESMPGITKSMQYALSRFGVSVEDNTSLQKFVGPPLREIFAHFNLSAEQVEQAVVFYRERYAEVGMLAENAIYAGIPELLKSLKARGVIVGLATSKYHGYARQILEYFNLEGYFSFIAGSEYDGRRSDKTELIAYALEQLDPDRKYSSCMVGDREFDIAGARRCGIVGIGVLYGYGSRDELTAAGADVLAETVEELGRLL